MKNNLLCALIAGIFSCGFVATFGQASPDVPDVSRQFFIENKGQWPEEVRFLTRIGGLDAWVTDKGITYDFYTMRNVSRPDLLKTGTMRKFPARRGHVVAMRFKNALDGIGAEARQKQPGYYNYLKGSDSSKWVSNVKLFKEVSLLKVYDGIDARMYFDESSLRYDMIVKAGANPSQIAMTFAGAEKISINKKGELVLKTSLGDVVQQKLFAFQEIGGKKKKVECRFVLKNGDVGFDVGKYDAAKPLVIDPLIYSTYIGGIAFDQIKGIAVDKSGHVYVTGSTVSENYPSTENAYDKSYESDSKGDAFITKFSKDGASLEYSTFIGGHYLDVSNAITLGEDSTVYITGYTNSWGPFDVQKFPVTDGAYSTQHNSPDPPPDMAPDAYVLRLNKFGSSIIFGTFIGGDATDEGISIAIDRNGNTYIAGNTNSTNIIPTSVPGFDKTVGNGVDGFVVKLNIAGSALVYATYLGNTSPNLQVDPPRPMDDYVTGIAIDRIGNVYITGTTTSEKFPTTTGAFDRIIGAGKIVAPPEIQGDPYFTRAEDIFLTKLNLNGGLTYSTFLGGDSFDFGTGIVVDKQGNAWVTGYTFSGSDAPAAGFPLLNAYDSILTGLDPVDGIIVKMNAAGSALLYSSYIGGDSTYSGGESRDQPRAIAIDSSGSVYIVGQTYSLDFPVMGDAVHDGIFNGGLTDAFAVKIPSAGGAPVYSTYIGGNSEDRALGIALDTAKDAYISGETISANFPIKNYGVRAFDSSFNSNGNSEDGFLVKLRMECMLAVDAGRDTIICLGQSVTVGNGGSSGFPPIRYNWSPVIEMDTTAYRAIIKPTATRTYYLTATDRLGCTTRDSIRVTINPAIIAEAGGSTAGMVEFCAGQDTTIGREATGGSETFKYKWTPSNGLSSDTVARPRLTAPSATQKYFVTVTDSRGCSAVDSITVIITNAINFASTRSELDFGELSACQKDDSLTFTITNNSGRNVKVRNYSLSNTAFKVTPEAGFNLNGDPSRADAKKTIMVKFTPQSAGAFKDSLLLITEPCGESFKILLKGTKLESLVETDANIYDFGKSYTCEPTTTRDTTVIIKNSGVGTITVKVPVVPPPYSLIDPPTGDFPKQIASGEELLLKIRLTQPSAEGPVNAIMDIPYESTACPASSISIDLMSTRVSAMAEIRFTNVTLPDITGCDTFRDTAVAFKNNSTESITIHSMAPAPGLQLTGTLPVTIAAGETALVGVRYSPDGTMTSAQAVFTYGPCDETLTATITGNKKGLAFTMPESITAPAVELCKGSSSQGTASITNRSGVNVILENAAFTGPFNVSDLQPGTVFKNNIAHNFNYTFTPTAAGDFTGTLTLKFNLCEFDTTIILKGSATEVKLTAQTIDGQSALAMGVVAQAGFKTDSVQVRNSGNAPATLTEINGLAAPFSILSPPAGYVLPPDESVFVVVRYDAAADGIFKDTLLVASSDPCKILLKTEVTAGEDARPGGRAQIAIGRDTSLSGSTISIPMIIQTSENLVQSNTKNYTAVISFNKNLLKPTGNTPAGVISGERRVITIDGTRGDTLGVLKELQFIAMLGNTACTDISIDSFTWTDGNATATTSSGEFCLAELCRAGGETRLIGSSTQFMLYQSKPNPAQDATEIEYTLVEPGYTTLAITDMLGRTIKTVVHNENHPSGHYSVTVNTADIPQGLYMYVLKSPTQSASLILQVQK
jgi:hypothetical protein